MRRIRESIIIKTILTLVLVLAIFTFIVSVIGYREMTQAVLNQYADGAFRIAGIASRFLDPDRIDEYFESGGEGEEYEGIYNRLSSICNSTGSAFIYVIRPDTTDYKHITFLLSVMNQQSPYSQYEFGYVRETTNEEYAKKYKEIYEEHAANELVIRDKGYIETDPHITAMVPLVNSKGECEAILCVQRQMEDLIKVRNSYVTKVLMTLAGTAMMVIIGLSLWLTQALLRPIHVITAEATRFASENIHTGEKLTSQIHMKDEIGQLAGAIDRMEVQVQDYVSNLTKATAEKERILTELSLAGRIQMDMVPNIFPAFPDRTDFDIYASMVPAREIGGDFYNFFLVDETHLCAMIADVSGKGVPAALFMMASTIVLVDNARMGKSPSEILESANEAICSTNREEMFVTVWLGILDLETGKLTAANAGHEYPVLKQPKGRFELIQDPHSFVVGGLDVVAYKNYEIMMEPGAKLFVYTDGVPEATARNNKLFGTDRLLRALNQEPEADPQKLLDNVREAVDAFVAEEEQFDDMTMLCLEYIGPGGTKPAKETASGQSAT